MSTVRLPSTEPSFGSGSSPQKNRQLAPILKSYNSVGAVLHCTSCCPDLSRIQRGGTILATIQQVVGHLVSTLHGCRSKKISGRIEDYYRVGKTIGNGGGTGNGVLGSTTRSGNIPSGILLGVVQLLPSKATAYLAGTIRQGV